jgi:threonine dehydrogenase-like Zn-dependent dehydrogenase
MRAAVLRDGQIVVRNDVEDPVAGFGQVLVEVKACGICGSDLHFAKAGSTMVEMMGQMRGAPILGSPDLDLSRDVFMGHEFAAEVLEVGPDTAGPEPGTLVTSVPIMISATGVQDLAYTNVLPAGYSERMLLSAPLVLPVPNGLDARRAALTEPLAVGLHAVNKSGIVAGEGAVVVGCGPVGIAVIAALSGKGIEPVVAADYSPMRRSLASTIGAHHVIDPNDVDIFDAWAEQGGARQLVVLRPWACPA